MWYFIDLVNLYVECNIDVGWLCWVVWFEYFGFWGGIVELVNFDNNGDY